MFLNWCSSTICKSKWRGPRKRLDLTQWKTGKAPNNLIKTALQRLMTNMAKPTARKIKLIRNFRTKIYPLCTNKTQFELWISTRSTSSFRRSYTYQPRKWVKATCTKTQTKISSCPWSKRPIKGIMKFKQKTILKSTFDTTMVRPENETTRSTVRLDRRYSTSKRRFQQRINMKTFALTELSART